ncbi:TetR/AcrR family transcriptional regulator [Gordonia sp. ABSL49_1]|uniref:TetR/AcrR family transcriptional regulator n=1 Tax=Gordonia sp. ABSL49_1 TaxID=2920941 RepID=UPI001F0F5C23|nr:TetR/AcrR family transcriptional regulator [Gordonia sp. ABSL49_1]MCH5642709.1 TetR/AcrR family transcriptional regulator [Gordonia sp. ABSL49_1]
MPRSDADERIRAAALDLLRTKGPTAVTIERVAEHTGMARTTIYRRYNDRAEMLTEVLRAIGLPGPAPEPMSGAQRLRWVIASSSAIVVDGIGFGGMAALMTDADPPFTEIFRGVLVAHRAAVAAAVTRGIEEGTLVGGVDIETLIDSIVGSLIAEYARIGAVGDDWAERLVRLHSGLINDSSH